MDKLKQLALLPSPLMPVLFVGHGNPMNAITNNQYASTWRAIGSNLPAAQAIVVISAHWITHGTLITDAPKQPIIYDFYGFPDELYKVSYEANGSPEIAKILKNSFLDYEAKLDSSWGLDHGTWSILKHLAPSPKVPVLQISIDMQLTLKELYKLFSELKTLRNRGVIFIGSGNIVHNLRLVNFSSDQSFDWAIEFDELSKEFISTHDTGQLLEPYKINSSARLAIPTDDHYRPLVAAMSLLDKNESLSFFNEDIDLGSIGMRSFITS